LKELKLNGSIKIKGPYDPKSKLTRSMNAKKLKLKPQTGKDPVLLTPNQDMARLEVVFD
jgi:hypothetical protein